MKANDAGILYGGAGNDRLYGEDNSALALLDRIVDDYLDGGDGADMLLGGAGNDELYGDFGETAQNKMGDDYLDGEEGGDLLDGRSGSASDLPADAQGNDVPLIALRQNVDAGGMANDWQWRTAA